MNDLRPGGRELIQASRRERTPDASDRARVLAAVLASAGATAATATAKAGPTGSSAAWKASPGVLKALLAAIIGLGAVTGVYMSTRSPAPASSHAESFTPAQAAASVLAPAPSISAPSFSAATPEPRAPAPVHGAAISSNGLKSSSNAPGAGSLDRELSLLQRAHAEYRAGQPAKALALVREHGRAFPNSQLSAEQGTLEVLSLCALGRTSEARAVARRLHAASGSPSLSGLDGSCVSH